MASNPDPLQIDRGLIVAPAGCGKTQLIADALSRHTGFKPILVLTHTNAGVVALRSRLDNAGVKTSAYRLSTIDGWGIRLVTTFPLRSGHKIEELQGQRPNYRRIREAAVSLLKSSDIADVLTASYARLFVDEYQDCSIRQHAMMYYAAQALPVCAMGDDMQAIFGFGDDGLADWTQHVCKHFPVAGMLSTPWRWKNADAEAFGQWLLHVRQLLGANQPIDLATAPKNVTWIQLPGTADADHIKLLEACRTKSDSGSGSVLIIGDSTSPHSQRRFASQTPGAIAVEAVDLRDLTKFAASFSLTATDALKQIVEFAEGLMTNVGANDLLRRVETIVRGKARKTASATEELAIEFLSDRTFKKVSDLLVAINREPGVRIYRPSLLSACLRSLELCQSGEIAFEDAAIRVREQQRLLGRPLPRRAVGSTLLLKGLEADVAVILNAEALDKRNLYVAITRGSKQLVICSKSRILKPT
jgi:superfamily I DNA/RNA helicase